LLAEDETDILLFPPLRNAWRLRGQPGDVVISGRNARRVVFGAMNLCTGGRWFLVRKRGRGEDFRAFLELLHEHYRSWHLALLLDEDSSHTDGKSQALVEELGIELIWMPKRSPKLNPMDHLWGQGKDIISGNRQYATIDQQVDLFIEHLENLPPRTALRTSGVLAPTFWLKSVLSKNFCGPA
jgi:transposase